MDGWGGVGVVGGVITRVRNSCGQFSLVREQSGTDEADLEVSKHTYAKANHTNNNTTIRLHSSTQL